MEDDDDDDDGVLNEKDKKTNDICGFWNDFWIESKTCQSIKILKFPIFQYFSSVFQFKYKRFLLSHKRSG